MRNLPANPLRRPAKLPRRPRSRLRSRREATANQCEDPRIYAQPEHSRALVCGSRSGTSGAANDVQRGSGSGKEAFWISYHSDHFEIRPCSVPTMVEQTGTDRFFTITSRNTHTYIMCGCVQHMCICIICTCIHIYSETDQNGLRTGRNQNGFRNGWNRPLRYIYVYIYI